MRTIRPTTIVFTAAVAIGAVLTGCGSDAGPGTLTEAEFVEQANALCATESQAVGQAIGALFGEGQPSGGEQQAALDHVVTLSRDLAGDIDALPEPSSLSDDVDQLLAAFEQGTDRAAAQTGRAFFARDDDPWSAAAARARDLGLDACGPQDE
jgi:hypothetical protein